MSWVCFLWACISVEVIFGKPPWSASCCKVITCLHLPLLPTRYQSIHLPGALSGFSTPLTVLTPGKPSWPTLKEQDFLSEPCISLHSTCLSLHFISWLYLGIIFPNMYFFIYHRLVGVKDCLSLLSYSPSTLSWLSINKVWIGWVFSWKNYYVN